MRVLVTGASGLLGINLALEASKQHAVFGTANRHALTTDIFEVIQTDLLLPGAVEQLLEQTRPDWVINCAALAIVDACERDPALASELNKELPAKLARYVARGGARLVHISTDAVFDGTRGEYTEADRPNPLSVYARTKLEGERAVTEANPAALIARVNLFGWSLSGERSLAEWFFNNLAASKPMMGFTDVYFCPLFANHLAQILLKMLESDLGGLYHVVSSECASKYEFGIALAERFGYDQRLISPVSIEQSELKAARSPNLTLKADRLIKDLGEVPPRISTGLDAFFRFYQQGYPQLLRKMRGG